MRLRNGNHPTSPAPLVDSPPIDQPSPTKSDTASSSASSHVLQRSVSRKMNPRHWFFVVLGLILLAGMGYWYWESQWIMTTGRMMFQQAYITSPLKGRVASIHVREGDTVKQGQVLVKLDDWEIQSELKKVQAAEEQARARLRLFESIGLDPASRMHLLQSEEHYTVARHEYHEAQADLDKARINFEHMQQVQDRTKRLYLLQALTIGEWEQSTLEFETVQAEFLAVEARLAKAAAAMQGAKALWDQELKAYRHEREKTKNNLALLRLDVQQAEADVESVRSQLSELEVTAAQAGIVSWLPRTVGEVVDHNDTVVGLMDPKEVWAEAYVEGDVFSEISPDQEAWVKIKGVSDDYLEGYVAMLYPSQRRTEDIFRVGPDKARSPSHLPQLAHPVKVLLRDPLPPNVRQEMIVWVWFTRQ